ncbi:MAG: ABC transporter permease [Spirochaetaceae bacterium]
MDVTLSSRNNRLQNAWKRLATATNIGPLAALILLVILLSLVSESFLTVRNVFNVLNQSSVQLIMALGMTMVIVSGGIDLSVGSVLALTGSVAALASASLELHPVLAVAAGLAAGAAIGMVNGFVISRTGIPDFIMTLGMLSAARGLALILTGGRPVVGIAPGVTLFGSHRVLGFLPAAVLVAAGMVVLMWFILRSTKLGRCAYAIGGNKEAAKAAGINVGNYKVAFYAVLGLCVAVGGILQIGRMNAANALTGQGWELQVIAIVIIGGTNLFGGEGSIGGTVVGALVLGVISNGLNLMGVSSFFQQLFIGVLIVLVVVIDQLRRRAASAAT